MKAPMKQQLRNCVAWGMLLAPVAVSLTALPSTVLAQSSSPQVRSLAASTDGRLEPGTSINFTLVGTPRAQASLRIRGLREPIALTETRWGEYEGSYTLRRGERIDVDSEVRVTLGDGYTRDSADYLLGDLLPQQRAFAAQPRFAEPRIERFGMRPVDRLDPGADLVFELDGLPGAAVSVHLPGVERDVQLRETRPGHYEGGYTVRRADTLNLNRPLVATLRSGDRAISSSANMAVGRPFVETERPRAEMRPPAADTRPPVLTFLVPAEGSTVPAGPSVHIAATFDDNGGSGVDPASVQIVVTGRNVTREAQISGQSFSFWGVLPPGRQTVDVTARDRAGNLMRRNWNFDVAGVAAAAPPLRVVPVLPAPAPPVLGPIGPAGLAAQILNHAPNAEIGPDPVLVRGRTAPFATVAVNVRAVPPATVADQPRIVFSQTLQADREGSFSFTLVPGIPIPGTRYDISMVARRDALSQESRFSLVERP
ncbi:MAG: hypothetical protein NVS3B2_11420 [Ramlibacter sp.]